MPAHCGGSNSDAVRAIVDLPTQLDGTVLLAVNDPTSIAPAAIGTSTAAPMAARRARRCGRRGARRDVRLIAPIGGSADTNTAVGTGTSAAPVTLLSADARFDLGALALRGVIANISIGDAEAVNTVFGQSIGSRIAGGYLEGAYDVLHLLAPASSQRLRAFARYERYDTQADVPTGVTRDPSLARRITTMGLTYKPTWNVAFKGDYQLVRNAAGVGAYDVLSLGVGYQF